MRLTGRCSLEARSPDLRQSQAVSYALSFFPGLSSTCACGKVQAGQAGWTAWPGPRDRAGTHRASRKPLAHFFENEVRIENER